MEEIVKKPGKIIIPSDQIYLQALVEFLEDTLRGFAMGEGEIADVAIAVTEIVNNAIVHGNKNNRNKRVEVRLSLKRSEVEITVIDEGDGFDLSIIPDPLSEENILKETGRGFFIVRSLMDKVKISTGKDRGTTVFLVKRFSPSRS
ncbi:MAG: ATP-binding protein [candidate division Zixibacteria bacterium CG_4_9_14_3_um_filter_46_8]|nr:MAG: ATP-binding protein [candidate division Zixibacteria bacterium CG_4_9_14_3_um_filter_46_8]